MLWLLNMCLRRHSEGISMMEISMQVFRTLFVGHGVLIAAPNGFLEENVQFTVEVFIWSVNSNFQIVLLLTSILSPCM